MNRLIVAFALVFSVGFVSMSQAELVAHWTGDNTAVDATGNGHNGTLSGGTTYAAGMIGQAFSFPGANDYITVAGDAALQPSAISVAMWVKAAPSAKIQLLVDTSHGGGGWAVQMFGANAAATQKDRVDFAYGNDAGNFPHVQSTSIVADNTWHHVLATMDGTNMRMYVDGALENTVAYVGTPKVSTSNSGNINIGRWHRSQNGSYRPLNGSLDDIRIYSNAVTAVPEPSSLASLAMAGLLLTGRRRRTRRTV